MVMFYFVGYLEQGLMVTEPHKLRRHYLQSIDSKLDVSATTLVT